jgi:hypothetical protein
MFDYDTISWPPLAQEIGCHKSTRGSVLQRELIICSMSTITLILS